MSLTHYFFPANTTPEPRFMTCGEFKTLNLHITKLINKKNALYKEIEELNQRNDPAKIDYLTLSECKYKIFLELVDQITIKIDQFNNQVPSVEIEDKINQYQLANELVLCFLDSIKYNIEILAKPRDSRKVGGKMFLFLGAITGAVAITSLASCTWPVVLLSAYLADRACSLGCYVSGVDTHISLTDSTLLIFNALQELIAINNKLYHYADKGEKDRENRDFYDILNVPFGASKDDITKAYRVLSLKYHPDKNKQFSKDEIADFTSKFISITEAYQTLTDPVKRNSYDAAYALRKNGPK